MNKHFKFPEGATPLTDCSGLIPIWVHSLSDLNRVEAENILVAQRKYLRSPVQHPKKWFRSEVLRKMHQAMFQDVWSWAGIYRKSITSIGVKPEYIPAHLSDLCSEVLFWMENPVELSHIEMAARIHHRLVFIHPFENGNGRFSRLVADRFLLAEKCTHPIWPYHLNESSNTRKEYICALQDADKGDYSQLIRLMRKLGASDNRMNLSNQT